MSRRSDRDFFEARLAAYGLAAAVGGYCFTPFAHFSCDSGAHCIACGMRTGLLALLGGDLAAAIHANPMSLLLGLAMLGSAVDVAVTLYRMKCVRGV